MVIFLGLPGALFYEQIIVRVSPELVTYQVNNVKLKLLLKAKTMLALMFMVSGFFIVLKKNYMVFRMKLCGIIYFVFL